ncbi:Late embryogenesis abundant (LEA) hydroxyproline-rich glycoprotein family [Thalictrum thalictroides]|uniref:Late embryogenesis abundant (LEA) hydroxyproline-rich glycoprotein family n=1 Tax=Thalictrum thalictroides TaxID=46969 RepID=A0A7J6WEY3_THATH|nr:Late embryogenesis abundant (LEA) hydroxyproline-rich glycoprotein family [Thalictrum thalictroides]
MTENNQSKPLAPFGYEIRSDQSAEEGYSSMVKSRQHDHRRRAIICFGCCSAAILISAVVITVLMLTAFRVKNPEIEVKRIMIPPISLNAAVPSTINIVAEFAVKNPNIATFKYGNSTILMYYHGKIVGEAYIPSGQAKARRTHNMTMTIDVITARFLADSKFLNEFASGILTVSSYTSLSGRVKIINIFKKHVDIKMNCTVTANITSQDILDQNCEKKVSL